MLSLWALLYRALLMYLFNTTKYFILFSLFHQRKCDCFSIKRICVNFCPCRNKLPKTSQKTTFKNKTWLFGEFATDDLQYSVYYIFWESFLFVFGALKYELKVSGVSFVIKPKNTYKHILTKALLNKQITDSDCCKLISADSNQFNSCSFACIRWCCCAHFEYKFRSAWLAIQKKKLNQVV